MAGYFKARDRDRTRQPDPVPQLKNPARWAMVDVEGRPLMGVSAQDIVKTYNNAATTGYTAGGRALEFSANTAWVGYGSNAALQLGTFTWIIQVAIPAGAGNTTLCNTNAGTISSGGAVLYRDGAGRIQLTKLDIASIIYPTAPLMKTDGSLSTVVLSYNSSTGRAHVAIDGRLATGTQTTTFNHGLVASNRYYLADTTFAAAHKRNLLAISPYETLDDKELISLSLNPWQIFQPISRRIWVSVPAGGSIGASSGTSTTAATGEAIINSVATSAGTSTTAATGEAIINSVATSAGTSTTAATAAIPGSVGASSGTSTATATGEAIINSVATSAGTSTAAATGEAIINSVATSSGTSTTSATSAGSGSTGASTGTSTASAIGASTSASDGSSAGLGAMSGVGESLVSSDATASGTSTVLGVGFGGFDAIGSSSGTSTVSGVGSAIFDSVGVISGSAITLAVGAINAAALGSSAGVSMVTGISASGFANAGRVELVHLTQPVVVTDYKSIVEAEKIRVSF